MLYLYENKEKAFQNKYNCEFRKRVFSNILQNLRSRIYSNTN